MAKVKNARILNRLLKLTGARCFEIHVAGPAYWLLLTTLAGSSTAWDSIDSRMLRVYGDVRNCLLRLYAAVDTTAEVYTDVITLRQCSV